MNKEMNELVNIAENLLSIVSRIDERVRTLEDKEQNEEFMSMGEIGEIHTLTERIEEFKNHLFRKL